jgi:hypothetical protein
MKTFITSIVTAIVLALPLAAISTPANAYEKSGAKSSKSYNSSKPKAYKAKAPKKSGSKSKSYSAY